jgi:hypothetical protein
MPPYHRPAEKASEVLATMQERAHAVDLLANKSAGVAVLVNAAERYRQERPIPDRETLEQLLDVAFFSSLLLEEGQKTRLSLAFVTDECADLAGPELVRRFAKPVPLTPRAIKKLATATDPWRTDIAVRSRNEGLEAWALYHRGSGRTMPNQQMPGRRPQVGPHLVVRATDPGSLTVEFSGEVIATFTGGTFEPPASLDETFAAVAKAADVAPSEAAVGYLLRIAERMAQLGHGGTLLIVKAMPRLDGISLPPEKSFTPHDTGLRDAIERAVARTGDPGSLARGECQRIGHFIAGCPVDELQGALQDVEDEVDYIARLSTVDGAVVMTRDLELVAFGAMLQPPDNGQPEAIIKHHPSAGGREEEQALQEIGGARHQSACRWCHAHPALGAAIVVSQDGLTSLVSRAPEEQRVRIVRPLAFSSAYEDSKRFMNRLDRLSKEWKSAKPIFSAEALARAPSRDPKLLEPSD